MEFDKDVKLPKILVGCPTSNHKSYCIDKYIESVKSLDYPNYDILLVDNSQNDDYYNKLKSKLPVVKSPYYETARKRITESRNILRDKALREGYDYFFSLEQDVIPPKDVISLLLNHKKKIVSALYFDVNPEDRSLMPMAWVHYQGSKARRMFLSEVFSPGRVLEVVTCGLGSVLIHRDVLEKIKFRYVPERRPFDDLWFSVDAKEANFPVYLDPSIKCRHLIKEWSWDKIKK